MNAIFRQVQRNPQFIINCMFLAILTGERDDVYKGKHQVIDMITSFTILKYITVNRNEQASMDVDLRRALFSQKPKSPTENGRPSSTVFKKAHVVIPAHIVAEAISTLHGLDLRCFISIPEIQARNKVLKQCGLPDEEYLVIFTLNYKNAMMLVGESYPFFRANYYMTIIQEGYDYIREFTSYKESKVIAAPETWLDLRIRGSQLSQYFRRKSKHIPKGLFSYPTDVDGTRYSMHWVSEAHRNSWHVLLDATALNVGEDRMNLSLHRPDFALCKPDTANAHPSDITCLLMIRRRSFETGASV
ncbi:hypothetical protein POM88_038821 [Heracleum sosnowskyi]|uniref:Uncharacterized protein n=1 Tax=Heracleum sosnowskyi TaxID=360622 RepID=A0AAD8H992_9APIA|nr:hypothetical protein POM88_038821 [Heracleum sosnowskyi]